jgi:hypothetical protein
MKGNNASGASVFYVGMALLGLAVALAGFSKTFFAPIVAGTFNAPLVVHLHGAAAFAWVLLFLLQPTLISAGRYDIHRWTGVFGTAIALAVAVTGVPVGLYVVERDLAAGLGPTAVSSLLGVITAMTVFLVLVAAGVAFRSRPAAHKRLMLLATIVVLWPAWFRLRHWFPDVPRPEIWFGVVAAYSLVPIAMLRDRLVEGRVHPVWWWVGLPVVAEQATEAFLFDRGPWRAVASALHSLLV